MTTDEAFGHARAALQRATSGNTRSIGAGEAIEVANVLEAALQALADVRTLDEWRAAAVLPWKRAYEFDENGTLVVDEWQPFARMGQVREGFDGSTPDEARAKAAAWVRGMK